MRYLILISTFIISSLSVAQSISSETERLNYLNEARTKLRLEISDFLSQEALMTKGQGQSCIPDPSCGFYKCQDEKYNCGKEGVFQTFAQRICEHYMDNIEQKKFSKEGAKWVYEVTVCLQKKMYESSELENSSSSNSEKICKLQEDTVIDVHRECYDQAGVCELSHSDKLAVFSTINLVIWDFMSDIDRIQNVVSHLFICSPVPLLKKWKLLKN